MYDEWGQRIAGGALVSEAPFFLDPLYPYFLGAVYALFGHGYVPVVAIQCLLGALVPPLLLLASRRWFDSTVCRTIGVIAALYIPSVYFEGILMKPGISMFLVALALWLLSRALGDGGTAWWLGAGVAMALACLTRGNLLLVLPVLTVWLLLRAEPDESSPLAERVRDRSRWIRTGAFVAGVGVILALPALHNYAVGGEWILTTSNAGQNFYIGNNPTNTTGEYQALPFVDPNPQFEQRDFKREAEKRAGRTLTHREISRFWFGESLRWIRAEPGAWLGVMFSKIRSYWGAYERPDSLDFYLYRGYAPVLRIPLPGFGLLAPLGLLGALLAAPRRGWPRLLLLVVVVYSLTVLTFFVFSRFRMVAVPALFVFAGFAAVDLARRIRGLRAGEGSWHRLWPAGVLVLLFVFVNVPVRATADTLSYRVAAAVGLPTRLETTANARFNLGVTYHKLAKQADDPAPMLERAETELRGALADDTKLKFYVELGKVLARAGRNREAIEIYREAEAFRPGSYRVQHALGLLHRRVGEPAAAESAFRRALERSPRHVASATELGQVLLELGRPEEAAQLFRYALRLAPDNRKARDGLAAAD